MAEGGSLAAKLRGFGPPGIAATLIIVATNVVIAPVGAILVLVWKWFAKVEWSDIGFPAPRSWVATLAIGVISGIGLKILLKAVVMPLLGAPDVNAHFHFIAGNRDQLISMTLASIVIGGFGEEIVYRGFLFERLGRLFGDSRWAIVAIVLLTTALFAAIHVPKQGAYGAVQAAIVGLSVATIYAMTRSLWLPIAIHAAYDVTAVLIIYLDAETRVARFFFG